MQLKPFIFFLPFIYSQSPFCAFSKNDPAFANCLRVFIFYNPKGVLSDVHGNFGSTTVTSACSLVAHDTNIHSKCLCDKATEVLECYTSLCSTDPYFNTATQIQRQYCGK